ncbi:MAG: hypothetical protein P1V51_19745 [Deltaproteobacteria bacterium]|nr:hypothetical protein [Deltaproteobacteria bacterium]
MAKTKAPATAPKKGKPARRRPKTKKVTERTVAAAHKRRKALELKKAGYTYEIIAQQVGYADRGAAHKAVQTALREITREPAEELLELQLQRLDDMRASVWARARKGDTKAIYAVVKIDEREAKLIGLNAPSAHEITGKDGAPIIDLSKLSDEELLALAALGEMIMGSKSGAGNTD